MSIFKGFVPKDEYMRVVRERDTLRETVLYYQDQEREELAANTQAALRRAYYLQPQEAQVIMALVRAKGRMVKKVDLWARVWGEDSDTSLKILDVRICHIRRKMGSNAIETLWGQGYRLTETGLGLYEKALDAYARKV